MSFNYSGLFLAQNPVAFLPRSQFLSLQMSGKTEWQITHAFWCTECTVIIMVNSAPISNVEWRTFLGNLACRVAYVLGQPGMPSGVRSWATWHAEWRTFLGNLACRVAYVLGQPGIPSGVRSWPTWHMLLHHCFWLHFLVPGRKVYLMAGQEFVY